MLRDDGPGRSPIGTTDLQIADTGQNVATQPTDASLLFSGVMLAPVGFFAGAVPGMAVERALGCRPGDDFCGLRGLLYGGVVVESAAVPLGVHLANRRRGK